ncbi:MAG: 6-phosphofructokinase [Desulfobacterales bacterium]|nr:6-phosphofructokinase [Desulfobacterales bacterium]
MEKNKTVPVEMLLKNPEIAKVTSNISTELIERRQYIPPLCDAFKKNYAILKERPEFQFDINSEAAKQLPNIINNKVCAVTGVDELDEKNKEKYLKHRKIGVVFSGGPAPGGHNVIAGLYDAAKKANPNNIIYGFLLGPDGIIENKAVEITDELVNNYRNLGGFTMIKTGRAKIDTKEKMSLSKKTCKNLGLDALVIVGGDDSNTNAAFLAESMIDDGIQVIGVPKTIDGDIQVRDISGNILCAVSFGFHTAARAFALEISNLSTDGSSDVKYWHICKVMGRVASHLALEVALQSHPNITLIGEELANYIDQRRINKALSSKTTDYTAYGMTLRHLSRVICEAIVKRASVGKNYGVLVIPEGILEFINEIQVFIIKLNTIIAEYNATHDNDFHTNFPLLEDKLEHLRRLAIRSREEPSFTVWNTRDDDLFNDMPAFFQEGLLLERDSHGNFQFSQVETDKVIMGLVKDYLNILKEKGVYKIGLSREQCRRTLESSGFNMDFLGPILFKNYDSSDEFLIVKQSIMSQKTLKQALVREDVIQEDSKVPPPIEKLYKQSSPKFSTQIHFYGYDGRGADPTQFDCNYTYNLGWTVFNLIANGATGQMAAIKNLEYEFSKWEPISIPIAPLMRLEERKGKLHLVLEKSVVDINSPAFLITKACRDKWLAAEASEDNYRRPGPIHFTGKNIEDRPITLTLNAISRESL